MKTEYSMRILIRYSLLVHSGPFEVRNSALTICKSGLKHLRRFLNVSPLTFNAYTPLILTECTHTVQTLAMTIEESIEEWRYADDFSDDSMDAESIIRGSRETGTNTDQRSLAFKYFQKCRA